MIDLETKALTVSANREKETMSGNLAAVLGPQATTMLAVFNGRRAVDWDSLRLMEALSFASAHGLFPAVVSRLSAADLSAAPSARQWQKWNTFRNLALLGETSRLVAALRADGITGVPFKGGVLGQIAHGEPNQRQAGDIDLFVRQRDLKAAVRTLQRCGYQLDAHWNSAICEGHFRFDCECEMVNPERQTCVDLHWEFTAQNFSLPLPVEAMFQRLEPVRVQGEDILCFGPEDMALILCVHAAKHYWSRLEWCFTLGEFIRRQPRLNWEMLICRASATKSSRIVATGLRLAAGLFHCDLPPEVQSWLKTVPQVDRLVMTALGWIRSGTQKPSAFAVRRFHALGREGFGAQSRYWMGVFFTPSEKDYARKLPAGFSWVYYLYRPLRLAACFAMSLCRRGPAKAERLGVPQTVTASAGNSGS